VTDQTMTPAGDSDDRDSRYCGGDRGPEQPPCRRPAGWGTPHPGIGRCKLHGGSTPTHVLSARREQARRAVATFGLPREVDPHTALLEEVHRTAGHVAWLGEVVQGLERDDLVWGVTEQVEKSAGEFPGTDTTYAAKPSVWLDLYQRERRHLVDVCKAAVAAGIEERRVRLAEQQGALLASVIRGVLADLDLSADQQSRVAEIVPKHLRAVAELETGGAA
jgi:hypothetical protein